MDRGQTLLTNEEITLISAILELGWPAIVVMQSIILYRAHSSMIDRYLSHLERESERATAQPPRLESERSDALS